MNDPDPLRARTKHRRSAWTWFAIGAVIVLLGLVVAFEVVIRRAEPILKNAVTDTLSTRFNSRVELEHMTVSVGRGLKVLGDRLRIYPPASLLAAGAVQPLIDIEHFSFHSGLLGLFRRPMHVPAVYVTGLQINIPPATMRRQASGSGVRKKGRIKIAVDEIVCDNSHLIIANSNPAKDPKDFELKHIELHDFGPNSPWKYDATLINAVPRGAIHSGGEFGPWQTDSPGDSPVRGSYTFNHADLNTIKGIGGILSSKGNFEGQLDKIVIDGTTETPNFSLDTANHPLLLRTTFRAIVDGITGDTYLQRVRARLGNSTFTASGAVINVKGRGHSIDLQVDVSNGALEDFLNLSVKTAPPLMTGVISTKARLNIRPGKESVSQKLSVMGDFNLQRIRFSNSAVQDKVDMLSARAQGDPKAAKSGALDVDSQMQGSFRMADGALHLSRLVYELPGAQVNLQGVYSLNGQEFNFYGKVLTQASLSHMVDSMWGSLALKTISPFFRNKGGGAQIPVSISGTRSAPKFGLDVFKKHEARNQPAK